MICFCFFCCQKQSLFGTNLSSRASRIWYRACRPAVISGGSAGHGSWSRATSTKNSSTLRTRESTTSFCSRRSVKIRHIALRILSAFSTTWAAEWFTKTSSRILNKSIFRSPENVYNFDISRSFANKCWGILDRIFLESNDFLGTAGLVDVDQCSIFFLAFIEDVLAAVTQFVVYICKLDAFKFWNNAAFVNWIRPCAFFSMFLVTFFSPNLRGRAEKKQNAQRKKNTGSVSQTTWPTNDIPNLF